MYRPSIFKIGKSYHIEFDLTPKDSEPRSCIINAYQIKGPLSGNQNAIRLDILPTAGKAKVFVDNIEFPEAKNIVIVC